MILSAAVSFIHNTVKKGTPVKVKEMIKKQTNQRACFILKLKYSSRTMKFERVLLNGGLKLYNNLSSNMRSLDVKQFKIHLTKTVIYDPT